MRMVTCLLHHVLNLKNFNFFPSYLKLNTGCITVLVSLIYIKVTCLIILEDKSWFS